MRSGGFSIGGKLNCCEGLRFGIQIHPSPPSSPRQGECVASVRKRRGLVIAVQTKISRSMFLSHARDMDFALRTITCSRRTRCKPTRRLSLGRSRHFVWAPRTPTPSATFERDPPSCAMNDIATNVAAAINKRAGDFALVAPRDPKAH